MNKKNIVTTEVTDLQECIHILEQFKDYEFLKELQDETYLQKYAEKLLDKGRIVVEYHNEIPIGLICFYCNDLETKIGFITALVLSENLGFMKGKTLFRLAIESSKIAKECGMNYVRIKVDKNNKTALKLYEHFGFRYLPDEDNDHYLMELPISNLMSNF